MAIIIVAWSLMGLFLFSYRYVVSTSSEQRFDWSFAFVQVFSNVYVWAALTPAILWLTARVPIQRDSWRRALAIHLLAGAGFASIGIIGRWLTALQLRPEADNLLARFFVSHLHFDFEWYCIIVGVGHAIAYYRRYNDHALRASQLEAQLAQAQLQALRMQLQPHFLFNTLHVISELVHEDPATADRMIARLGDLLRVSIDAGGVHEVTLRQELEFLNAYLEIEQMRFREQLTVEMMIAPEALDAHVPNLILQPLVENAIKHGLSSRAEPGRIDVAARRDDSTLQLEVRDNGIGLPGAVVSGSGVGLQNTRARLQRLYGAGHQFDVRNDASGGVVATVVIPFRTATSVLTRADDASGAAARPTATLAATAAEPRARW